MIMAMPQRYKGDRAAQTVRIPVEQHDLYCNEAARVGLDVGPYLVWRLALAHGLTPTEPPKSADSLDLGDLMAS